MNTRKYQVGDLICCPSLGECGFVNELTEKKENLSIKINWNRDKEDRYLTLMKGSDVDYWIDNCYFLYYPIE